MPGYWFIYIFTHLHKGRVQGCGAHPPHLRSGAVRAVQAYEKPAERASSHAGDQLDGRIVAWAPGCVCIYINGVARNRGGRTQHLSTPPPGRAGKQGFAIRAMKRAGELPSKRAGEGWLGWVWAAAGAPHVAGLGAGIHPLYLGGGLVLGGSSLRFVGLGCGTPPRATPLPSLKRISNPPLPSRSPRLARHTSFPSWRGGGGKSGSGWRQPTMWLIWGQGPSSVPPRTSPVFSKSGSRTPTNKSGKGSCSKANYKNHHTALTPGTTHTSYKITTKFLHTTTPCLKRTLWQTPEPAQNPQNTKRFNNHENNKKSGPHIPPP